MRVCIATAPWAPGRREALATLVRQLDPIVPHVFESRRREHSSIWERRVWEWIEAQDEPVIKLEDAISVSPNLVQICSAIARQAPGEAVSLHNQCPESLPASRAGHRWVKTYWLSGSAMILPPQVARNILDYVAELPWVTASALPWDNITMHYAWKVQKPWLAVLPALACRDVGVPSTTTGADEHVNRQPHVQWTSFGDANLASPDFWTKPVDVPLIANPWASPEWLNEVRLSLVGDGLCSACMSHEAVVRFPNGSSLCHSCAKQVTLAALGRIL
jgi:hypothetical protein